MQSAMHIFSLVLLHLFMTETAMGGKVLVWPMEDSHWINMKFILDELVHRGHDITVLLYSGSTILKQNSSYNFETFEVPGPHQSLPEFLEDMLNLLMYETSSQSLLNLAWKIRGICDGILRNFDIILSDPLMTCSELIADKLGIPFIYTFRFSFGNTMERLCGQLPSPFSYIRSVGLQFTDKMTYVDRMKNILAYFINDFLFYEWVSSNWDSYFYEITGTLTLIHAFFFPLPHDQVVVLTPVIK
uniref:UDP-glucuronosyltransferase n=1 Tax=Erpetoichthys calabaricus TaxID=27687 RepID=A0A8C4T1E8_ERPCA